MALQFLFDPNTQFQNRNGVNNVGGFLRVYINGTDDRADTYCDFNGTLNEADIGLDTDGRAVVIVDNSKTYRIEVYDAEGALLWTCGNYTSRGGGGGTIVQPVSVEGTENEIAVTESEEGGIKHFVVSIANAVKTALSNLQSSITSLSLSLNGKKNVQTPSSFNGSTTKTLVGISQDANGEITPTFDDISFPDYSQRFENIENEQAVDAKVIASALNDLNARMESVEDSQCDKNIGERIADALDSQNLFEGGIRVKVRQAAKSLDGTTNKTVTNISQDENGVITVTYSAISFPDWTSTITDATDLCEKLANKKTTFSGFETSNTYYPTLNAVVEYLDGRLQNLGGKKITNNGQPFTSDSQLPSSSPYYGQNINTDDYAFVQDTGLASRYTAIVSGSSVSWSLDYEIALPVFTAEQQAAIDSGVNSTKVGNYDSHISNTSNPHNVTAAQIGAVRYDTASQGLTSTQKQNARTNIGAGTYSVPSGGIPKTDLASGVQSSLDKADSALQNHQSVVNSAPTLSWGNTSTVGSVGGTALTVKMPSNPATGKLDTNGDGSDVTASFTTAGSRNNISTGEKLSVIFGKIAKWFGDLKAVAFSGNYNDLSDKPTIPTVNNGTLTIYRNGVSQGTFSANQSGLTGIDISVPTKTSQLVNDSFASVATSGSYNDLSNKPSIPSAANNGTLTIRQNGTSKGTFSANQSDNTEINVTDTTYENKAASEGSPDVSLVTAGDKFDWNFAYRQLFKLTKYVAGSEATQGTVIELGEFSWGPGYRLRFTISIEDTSSDYTLGINIPFSTGVNQQWNGWLANTGNYDYCTQTEYRVGTSSPGFGVFGNNGTFPGVGQSRRIGDITIPRFSAGGVPVGMYRGKFLISGYSDGLKSFVLDVDLCYKCANSGTTWWGYVSLLPNDMHA